MLLRKSMLTALLVAGSTLGGQAADLGSPRWPGLVTSTKDAQQTPLYNYTGLYISGEAGYQVGTNELTLHQGGPPLFNVDGVSTRGPVYGARGGFDYQPVNVPFVFGVLAGYSGGDADFTLTLGPNTLKATITPEWHAGLRAGFVLPNKSLLYGGYVWQEGELNITVPGGAPSIKVDLQGHGPIAGLEVPLNQYMAVAFEYKYIMYDKENLLPAAAAPTQLDLDADVHTVQGRFILKTGALFK